MIPTDVAVRGPRDWLWRHARETLFEPFFRAPEARLAANGLGIGLALCQRIVSALGGRIWAIPRDGGGAEVGFALPSAAPEDLT